MKRIVLYGAGGFARETAYLIDVINYSFPGSYWFLGFLVDEEYYKPNQVVNGYPVLGTSEWIKNNKDVFCVCCIANNEARSRIQTDLMNNGVQFETLIAPYLPVPPTARIGRGCVISGNVALSVNTVLGDGVFLNNSVTIGHDVVIGDYSSIMPGTGISGGCYIGKKVYIGGHAFLVPDKTVGDNAVIAAGSIVFRNVKEGTTVLGNPAQRMKELENK